MRLSPNDGWGFLESIDGFQLGVALVNVKMIEAPD